MAVEETGETSSGVASLKFWGDKNICL